MSKFKVGDKYVVQRDCDFARGTQVTAVFVEPTSYDGELTALWEDSNGIAHWLYDSDVQPLSESVGPFVINGSPVEYHTLEAAEDGVKAIGNNGVTYEIAQIVKRVKVKRETVVTLEGTV